MKTNCNFQLKWRGQRDHQFEGCVMTKFVMRLSIGNLQAMRKMLKCCNVAVASACNFQFGQFMRMNDLNPQSTRSSRLTPTAQSYAGNPFVSAKRMLKRTDRCLLVALWCVVLHSPPTEMTQPRTGQWTGHRCRVIGGGSAAGVDIMHSQG